MKKLIKNILAFGITFIVCFSLIFFGSKLLNGEPEFKIYKNSELVDDLLIEVEVFELNAGFDLLFGYNETLFEECAIKHKEVSNVGFVDVMMNCMNNTGLKPVVNNITKEDLTFSWIKANCDVVDEGYACGKFLVVSK